MSNKQNLVRALQERGLIVLAERAKAGEFSDFASPHALPLMTLAEALRKHGAMDLRQRVMDGEFDHDR